MPYKCVDRKSYKRSSPRSSVLWNNMLMLFSSTKKRAFAYRSCDKTRNFHGHSTQGNIFANTQSYGNHTLLWSSSFKETILKISMHAQYIKLHEHNT